MINTKNMIKKLLHFSMFFLSLFVIDDCLALQVKTLNDNQTALFKISATELTRIFIDDDRIESVRGLDGQYQLIKDEDSGAIFIKPEINYQNRPFNIFIATEQGRSYTLFLSPLKIPAQTIELKPLSPIKAMAARWEKGSTYSDMIIQLMNDMVNHTRPEGYAVITLKQIEDCEKNKLNAVPLKPQKISPDLSMKLLAIYQGSNLNGEVWRINNRYCRNMQLHLTDFYQSNVRALALKDESLSHCASTLLYRVVNA